MAEEGNAYIIALESLQEYENDLRDAFMNVAGESDQIGIDSFPELLDNISSLLGFDCENAKIFFSWDNTELPENYDLNALDFIQFYELFGLWLHKESLNYPATVPGTTQIGGPDFSVTLSKDNITSRSTPGVETNMAIMKELVKQSQDKFESLFNEYIQEEGQERITVEACYDFLVECLRSSQIELKEKVKSIKDSYKNLESSQRFLEIAEKYFLEEKKLDSDDFDINEQTLSFKDCFEILDFWLRNDENVVLLDKRKKTRGAGITAALKETIEKYEKMIQETQDENEKEVLETTIETLKAQLRDLENGMGKRSKSVKDGLDYQKMEEKRFKALKEIFDVYCLLQLNLGKMGTFEKYKRVSNTITLGTFKVILKDFRLKISHLKVVELFNKTTMTDENMSFDEFIEFLTKIALRVEIVTEERVHQPNPEIRKEYRPDCYKKDNNYKIFKENEAKKKQIFASINRKERNALLKDHVKRDADKLEEIWEHMGLYDGTYKNWISLVRTPFHIKDKNSVRLAPESVNYKFKPKTGDSLQEIQRRNEMRRLVKDLKTVEKSFISNFKATSSHSVIRTELSLSRPGGKEDSYSQQRSRTKKSVPNIKKLTMKGVENFHDEDLMKIDDRFNPQELIQENDEEDDMYLAEYNIHEVKVKQPEHSTDLKKYDNYGRLKKASKGFAVNGKYGHSKNSESRSNLLDGDGAYPSTYSQYESRNFNTNPKGTPNNSNAPNSIKYTTKGTNSIYRPTPMDYSTNMSMKQVRNAAQYASQDGSANYTHDYNRNTYNYEYSSGNAPYVAVNGYVLPRNQGYGSTQNRIDRIERDAQLKQQQMMDNIMSIQQQQLQKGLKTFRK